MSETLEAMATRLAQWFDAADEDRFPTDVRYWCINEARKEIIRNNNLRWGRKESTWSVVSGDYQKELATYFPGWLKPLELWWYNAAEQGTKFLEHITPKEYIKLYPDPTDSSFQGSVSKFTTTGQYLKISPADDAITLYVYYYALPTDLTAGGSDNTDDFLVEASSAIFWTSMGYANDFFPGEEGRDPIWEDKAARFIDELVIQETRNARAGMPMTKRSPGHTYQD
jgi:hypothetical protein